MTIVRGQSQERLNNPDIPGPLTVSLVIACIFGH